MQTLLQCLALGGGPTFFSFQGHPTGKILVPVAGDGRKIVAEQRFRFLMMYGHDHIIIFW